MSTTTQAPPVILGEPTLDALGSIVRFTAQANDPTELLAMLGEHELMVATNGVTVRLAAVLHDAARRTPQAMYDVLADAYYFGVEPDCDERGRYPSEDERLPWLESVLTVAADLLGEDYAVLVGGVEA